ncbi:hypothetical protein HPY31_18910 [Brevibacillus sp. HB1.3]|uniref:hypothetical protein n=1 Tax=Brevibacillus sp. HB1.3 TaxID=2738842 RepID=UPI0015539461|nr:hypothetical protein [Brevibacillus sp. HB1.3]NQF15969.1 hypothetical protein [Brevibacillus sp. HB1.3]
MDEITAQYERKVEEEERLLTRIRTCEAYLMVLLEHTCQKGTQYHIISMEEIFIAVHTVCNNLRNDLLHVQLAKALLSCQMGQREKK